MKWTRHLLALLGFDLLMLSGCFAVPSNPESKRSRSRGSQAVVEQPLPAGGDDAEAKPDNKGEDSKSSTKRDLQAEALAILDKNCVGCHSATNIQGNFGSLDNIEAMLASGRYLVAGSPEKSLIYTKLAPQGNMPPSGALKAEDVATIKGWITDLKTVTVVSLKDTQVLELIQKDLQTNIVTADQDQVRYFSLHVPNNLGANAAAMDSLRQAFLKVINSLSRSPVLIKPVALDPKKLVYRLRLDEMAIPVAVFESVMNDFYPFMQQFVSNNSDPVSIQAAQNDSFMRTATGSSNYLIRADWFIATATLPIPYERLLQLGPDQASLDADLGVNLLANLNANRVMRAGFKNSGVSSQNRVIERHNQRNGLPYWISYDFARLDAIENIFVNPLGPENLATAKSFQHDGGEIIFQLPNGLFGYRLITSAGVIIDKGPTSIVKQADAPPAFLSAIVNGVSCMNCHGSGLLYKKDEIRQFSQQNSTQFTQDELNKILNLYPEERIFKAAMDKDNSTYLSALTALGIDPQKPDPVNQAFRLYNRSLSKTDVREELGVSDGDLERILNLEPFRTQWGSLRLQGLISRQELTILYAQAVEQARFNVNAINPSIGDFMATPDCMFANQVQMDLCFITRASPAIAGQ